MSRRNVMLFNLQPILKGKLVTLRPLVAADFNELFAVASDPLTWEQHPNRDRYKEDVFREFFRIALESGGAFAVLDNATGTIIGSSRYHGYDSKKRVVEIGWTFLARSHWGGRYNGEMKQLMLNHAFRFVDTVLFVIGPDNIRSQRAVEKIGAVRARVERNHEGQERVIYKITAEMFAGANNNT